MDTHRPHDTHSAIVSRARELIEQSKALLERSSASTFLGVGRCDPFPVAGRSKRIPSLKVIDGDQGRSGRKEISGRHGVADHKNRAFLS